MMYGQQRHILICRQLLMVRVWVETTRDVRSTMDWCSRLEYNFVMSYFLRDILIHIRIHHYVCQACRGKLLYT